MSVNCHYKHTCTSEAGYIQYGEVSLIGFDVLDTLLGGVTLEGGLSSIFWLEGLLVVCVVFKAPLAAHLFIHIQTSSRCGKHLR